MTRHGSLAYYLAAWVCGCFFMTLGAWFLSGASIGQNAPGLRSAAGLLVLYFFGLIFGLFPSLLFAFLLRRVMTGVGAPRLWAWVLAGAALAYPFLAGLGWIGRLPRRFGRPDEFLWALLFAGYRDWPRVVLLAAIPAAAATSAVLFSVHRAFARKIES
jgi:hypothetical protein